jgi:hypothetical protein
METVKVMQPSHETEQEKLSKSIAEIFIAERLGAEQEHLCASCGAVMQSIDVTFWLYGTDSGMGCTVRAS